MPIRWYKPNGTDSEAIKSERLAHVQGGSFTSVKVRGLPIGQEELKCRCLVRYDECHPLRLSFSLTFCYYYPPPIPPPPPPCSRKDRDTKLMKDVS
ncbi:hypothetical protein M0802_009036 [Mischocyttarus mexicanus]|nr:hypothetical protein M0802_009036 [Mischocyttarus mexicanus]